jgi:1-acyl-sn-glycerol-3-phosphate acyltransferase
MGAGFEGLARWLVKTVYRVERRGCWDKVPAEGGAVLVSNHVSYVDAAIIAACSARPIRFVMDHRIFASRMWGWLFRRLRAIPIAPAKEDGVLKERAFAEVAAALAEGDLVCIFPEGRLSPTGEVLSFQHGIERIVRETPVPVVPVALHGLWGSVFSRAKQSAGSSWAEHIRRRVRVVCGAPVAPHAVSCSLLEQRVRALGERA